jgi:gamma-butyrobetaine dioxygenase
MSGPTPRVQAATSRGGDVRVTWDAGVTARFHACWLRDNCPCPDCRHATTGELVLDQLHVPVDVAVVEATVGPDGELDVRWDDGHRGRFCGGWLHAHRYDDPADRTTAPAPSWGAELGAPPRFTFADVVAGGQGLRSLLEAVAAVGLAVVAEGPTARGTVVELADAIGFVLPSNFGATYDVVTLPDARSNAYTALGLVTHTDLPHHAWPPGVQLLHCRENSVTGGESTFVDGRRVVEALRDRAPDALDVLTREPIPYRYVDEGADHRYAGPAIELDGAGDLRIIRYAPNVVAPLQVAFDRLLQVRRAYQALGRAVDDPAHVVRYRLQPGDIIVNDNHRVLHGRDAFDPTSGRRVLEGCYVDRSELDSKRRVLARGAA